MFRREFLEVLGVSGLGSKIASSDDTWNDDSMDVELLVALPYEPGEYMARIVDDAFETTGYWRGNVEENPNTVSAGTVDVRSDHGFVMTEAPSNSVSGSFFWIEGMSKAVVDFREEELHLVYRDTEEDRYWTARKKSAYHRYQMEESLHQARTSGENHRREMWRRARHHHKRMYSNSKKAIAAKES